MSGENIGLLAGTGHSLLGAVGALMLTPAPRIKSVRRQLYLFLFTLIVAVILISITPLLRDFWPLFAAIALGGLMLGFNQPLMISVMAAASPPGPGTDRWAPDDGQPGGIDDHSRRDGIYDRSDRASCQFLPDGRTYDGGLPLDLVPDVASFQSR